MLIEQLSHANRWRRVHPATKCLFTLCAMVAAFLAHSPAAALTVALLTAAAACLGARIPPGSYLRASAPPLLFLLVSCVTLAVSVGLSTGFPWIRLQSSHAQLLAALNVGGRSLACLTSLMFLALTTPLNDLISLLRGIGVPAVLTDLMTLCYGTLFIFSESAREIVTAQSSRLGYATPRLALRSTGIMVSSLAVRISRRSRELQHAAFSRANDGPLRFLSPTCPASAGSFAISLLAGCGLIALALAQP